MKSLLLLFGLSLTIGAAGAQARPEATEQAFIDAVKPRAMPLQIAATGLSGAGAQWLVGQAADAQFVLIGEDHGFADTPQFAQGLQASLGEHRFDHLVLEVGFDAARRVEAAACERADGLERLNRDYPFFAPFVNFREDGALAASFAACGRSVPGLWGVDQEFLLSSQMQLHRLDQLASNERQRKQLAPFRAQADAAWDTMVKQHEAGSIALMRWTAQDFDRMRAVFGPQGNREALELIDAMATSAALYNGQNTDPFRSNRDRSRLMKSNFMRNYTVARATQAAPRALFKLGAYHAARGLTPTQQFDLGNMASELAESNGGRSLHVLVLMSGGEVNRYFPFSADDKDKRAAYDAKTELKSLGVGALLAIAPSADATVIDLIALRAADGPRMPSGSAINRLIYNYDAVVLIANGRAAGNY